MKLWEGVVRSGGNSQHLFDWYTFSHIIHGFVFYYFLGWLFPKFSVQRKLIYAVGIEVGWEVLENTPMVINHYRQQALAQGYVGDSIINSLSDTMSMLFGFLLAIKKSGKFILVLAIMLELYVGYMIRDNLTLNVLNLIYVFPFISKWQSGI